MASEKKMISLTFKVGLVLFAVCILVPVSLMALLRHAVPLQTLRLLFSAGPTSSEMWEEEKMYYANQGGLLCECDMSSLRSDVCELKGDVRVILSNVTIIALLHPSVSVRRRSRRMKPHARRKDGGVTEVLVSVTPSSPHVPGCMAEGAAPAVVFSVGGGYAGNMLHDFTDVLIPLFITAGRFRGDVHLLVRDAPLWWVDKYRPLLRGLSRHAVIDMDRQSQSAQVLCYPHVVVGLSFQKEMSVDAAKTAGGHYSMAGFARLARRSYGLERDTAIRLLRGGSDNVKSPRRPRLLIISRKTTVAFTNMGIVAQAAAMLGYEVIVGETAGQRSDLSPLARLVNSCDVLVGVHGAGLTNLVFLPPGGVVVQVVPPGWLEAMAREDLGVPAGDMGLGYVRYTVAVGESTLPELYPRLGDPAVVRSQESLALRSARTSRSTSLGSAAPCPLLWSFFTIRRRTLSRA